MSLQTINFDLMNLQAGARLLDLGCGEGRHAISAYHLHSIDAVGIDLSVKDVGITKARAAQFLEPDNPSKSLVTAVADGSALPFAAGQFDRVICAEVLEHIHDYRAIIREINRVTRMGGLVGISVPRFFPEWVCWQLSRAYHEVEGGHIRIFNARHLRRDLEESGFVHIKQHHAHALHVPYWWLKCAFWREGRQAAIVDGYHRFLTWELMHSPWITRLLDKLLNPIMGKSVVMYFIKTEDLA